MPFNDWLGSIAEAGRELWQRARGNGRTASQQIESLCRELCTSRGEAMGTAIAQAVLSAYRLLDAQGRLAFFRLLHTAYGPDREQILHSAERYREQDSEANLSQLQAVVEGERRDLFRRINMAPGGTATILAMRKDLLALIREYRELKAVDDDLLYVLKSWFNRGFLSLASISWQTPAHILEKLIAYEAVHEMNGWEDLRRRLAEDRRCFAFFHPALPDEPLIFVEVALVEGIAGNIQALLEAPSAAMTGKADTAIFYSISNCQEGLLGISFGNFLIKQVVMELRRDFPALKQFVTLSPIPGFRAWLEQELQQPVLTRLADARRQLLVDALGRDWPRSPELAREMRSLLMPLCAIYLTQGKRGSEAMDPVERFHLGNGARIERLNWLADSSKKGIEQSCGMMVNYAYQLGEVEANHEAYVNQQTIVTSKEFRKLLDPLRD